MLALESIFLDLSIGYHPEVIHSLHHYLDLLEQWSQRINLTSVRGRKQMVLRHIADCLAIHPYVSEHGPAMDLGSGAGLPGLVLAMLRPKQPWFLLEKSAKKCAFLRTAVAELKLDHVEILQQRLESITSPCVTVMTARAFAASTRIINQSKHCLQYQGRWYLMLSEPIFYGKNLSGVRLIDSIVLKVPNLNETRSLLVLEKTL